MTLVFGLFDRLVSIHLSLNVVRAPRRSNMCLASQPSKRRLGALGAGSDGELCFERLGSVSFMCYHASTPDLSTWWSSTALWRDLVLRRVSRLDAFSGYPSERSYPAVPLARQPVHQRFVHPGPLVLRADPLKSRTPTADRDRTVSRRSKPSSRTTLIGEQPNPWDLLQPQDVMSRHRGAKLPRRYGLLGAISLLSPAYLLSVERWPFHAGPPDH